ncbi:MAG TPA: GNAT family N-acetyltransferase [Burkholderiales bacterium]|nr:GNAT family N-acetyltransferase [Burkholderiales bacterium]
MTFRVVPIAEEHIEGFWAALDSVARERRYLIFLEAPPFEECRKFVAQNIRRGHPQHVALAAERVVGWCDVLPVDRPIRAHTGVLGLAVLAAFRGRGIGTALLSCDAGTRPGRRPDADRAERPGEQQARSGAL